MPDPVPFKPTSITTTAMVEDIAAALEDGGSPEAMKRHRVADGLGVHELELCIAEWLRKALSCGKPAASVGTIVVDCRQVDTVRRFADGLGELVVAIEGGDSRYLVVSDVAEAIRELVAPLTDQPKAP